MKNILDCDSDDDILYRECQECKKSLPQSSFYVDPSICNTCSFGSDSDDDVLLTEKSSDDVIKSATDVNGEMVDEIPTRPASSDDSIDYTVDPVSL